MDVIICLGLNHDAYLDLCQQKIMYSIGDFSVLSVSQNLPFKYDIGVIHYITLVLNSRIFAFDIDIGFQQHHTLVALCFFVYYRVLQNIQLQENHTYAGIFAKCSSQEGRLVVNCFPIVVK